MGTFFKGWRRKAGCVTLVLATFTMGAWIRSIRLCDDVEFSIGIQQHEIRSFHPQYNIRSFNGEFYFLWWLSRFPRQSWECIDSANEFAIESCLLDATYTVERGDGWTVAYGNIAIPLTLLSACLILWTPRNREPQAKQV